MTKDKENAFKQLNGAFKQLNNAFKQLNGAFEQLNNAFDDAMRIAAKRRTEKQRKVLRINLRKTLTWRKN